MFLVVYSDRGLVNDREPSLRLFNILYWLSVSTFTVLGCASYIPLFNEAKYKDYLEGLCILCLDFLLLGLLETKNRRYVAGQCLNQTTFAAFGGKRRRNVFSGRDTRNYLHCMQIFFLLDLLAEKYPVGSLYHYVLHGTTVTFWAFIFAVFIPIKHYYLAVQNFPEMFCEEKKIISEEFYIRKPEILIPRHPCNMPNIKQQEKELVASEMESALKEIVPHVSNVNPDYSNTFHITVQVHSQQNENQNFKRKKSRGLPAVEI